MKQANWVRPDCRKKEPEPETKKKAKTKPESVTEPEQGKAAHNG